MSTLFNDTIYAKKGLDAFRAALAPFFAFAHDFSEEARNVGDAIIVPRYDAMSPTTFAYANNSNFPYEGTDGTAAAITVNLNQHQIVPLDLSDKDLASSSAARMDNFAVQQAHALAKKVIQNIWSQVTTGSFGAAVVTTAVANWNTLSPIKTMRKTLSDRNVPTDNRSLFVNTEIYNSMLDITVVQQANTFGSTDTIRNGKIGRVLGFDLYESTIIPANGISLAAFAVHADALAVAMRYLEPGDRGQYAAAFAVSDPETGITIGYRRHYNPGKGKWFLNMEALFGFANGLTLGIAIATVP